MASGHELRTRYATCDVVTGTVVGLATVREQYIEGYGFLTGHQGVSGYYHGAHGLVGPTGPMFPAAGHLSGSGSLLGSSAVRTRYVYETRFFLRGADGLDRLFRFPGVSFLPVLGGHTVSAVLCKNDLGRSLLLALVNHSTRLVDHSTRPTVLRAATEDEIIVHLDIPLTRRVRLKPEQRKRLQAEQRAEEREEEERHRRLLVRKRQTRQRFTPFLLVTSLIFLSIAGLGLYLLVGGKDRAAGLLMLAVGGVGVLAGSGVLGYFYFDEWDHAGKPPEPPDPIETHERVSVPNKEVDRELDRIEGFIADVARSGRPGTP